MTLELLQARAIEALGRGDWGAAQDIGGRMLRLAPHHASSYFVAGVAALRLQQLHAAIEYLRRAVMLAPTDAESWPNFPGPT
jgi:Flp pilus assembly protein TadD